MCGDLGLGTRDEELGDIKYGTRGDVGQGRGTLNTGMRGRQIQGCVDVKYRDAGDVNIYCKSQN